MEIVIASHNVHKIRELRDFFKVSLRQDILSLHHFPHYTSISHDGKTFQENAVFKAEYAAKALNKWVLADDSGIVVPSLEGNSEVPSRWYASDESTDMENRQKLLKEMKDKTELERAAYYECCLALAAPDGLKKMTTGVCEGWIAFEERGRNGFDYDAIFIKHDYKKTFAELGDITKNRISHRRKAFEKMNLFFESTSFFSS